MKKRVIESVIGICHMEELDNTEIRLVKKAIEATERSYARYSNFKVGAALLWKTELKLSDVIRRTQPILLQYVPSAQHSFPLVHNIPNLP